MANTNLQGAKNAKNDESFISNLMKLKWMLCKHHNRAKGNRWQPE